MLDICEGGDILRAHAAGVIYFTKTIKQAGDGILSCASLCQKLS